jgi:hypothetical protein
VTCASAAASAELTGTKNRPRRSAAEIANFATAEPEHSRPTPATFGSRWRASRAAPSAGASPDLNCLAVRAVRGVAPQESLTFGYGRKGSWPRPATFVLRHASRRLESLDPDAARPLQLVGMGNHPRRNAAVDANRATAANSQAKYTGSGALPQSPSYPRRAVWGTGLGESNRNALAP